MNAWWWSLYTRRQGNPVDRDSCAWLLACLYEFSIQIQPHDFLKPDILIYFNELLLRKLFFLCCHALMTYDVETAIILLELVWMKESYYFALGHLSGVHYHATSLLGCQVKLLCKIHSEKTDIVLESHPAIQ